VDELMILFPHDGSIDKMNLFCNYNFSGLFLVAYSIQFGIETAKGFRWLLHRLSISSGKDGHKINCKVDSYRRQLIVMVMFLVILGILWGVSGALVKAEFKHGGNAAQLWFACMVGPMGVWIRWFLARLNGRGLGKEGLFKWIPFGTLIANVSAACIMAALACVKNAVSFVVIIHVQLPLTALSNLYARSHRLRFRISYGNKIYLPVLGNWLSC